MNAGKSSRLNHEATFEYDVALSFAGEQRGYVDRVAELLRARRN